MDDYHCTYFTRCLIRVNVVAIWAAASRLARSHF